MGKTEKTNSLVFEACSAELNMKIVRNFSFLWIISLAWIYTNKCLLKVWNFLRHSFYEAKWTEYEMAWAAMTIAETSKQWSDSMEQQYYNIYEKTKIRKP